jgi:hypothetical protein
VNKGNEQGVLTFEKTVRRIEQEAKFMSESFDSIFEKVPVQQRPFDLYEQQFMKAQGKVIPEVAQLDMKEKILEAEQKLKNLNREFEQLK